ncbi:hypothetical protein H072_6794 [Dactylellina haptotyla CBS 200.50]|uniref:Lipid-binding serum glycoprotein N-terminal domain-containing protein n=1 Tax=Dactylellina haptotyla (strain CBS 200.50) TaxID=1284197 RepID=S8AE86_DACHA|nr:hypothetical protein H072_6794 [Dactylellina haptotyla CBS 200.50]
MQSLIRLLPLVAAANALVPAPRPIDVEQFQARGLGTSADVYIYNEWNSGLTVSAAENTFMSTGAPGSVSVASNSVSDKFSVEANGWIPLQSKFKLILSPDGGDASTVNIDIGMSPFKTRYSLGAENPVNQAGVMLAPAKILEKGRDFDFHIFSGPGSLTPFIQSLVDQKLPGILEGIKQKPVDFAINKDISVTIRDIVNPVVKANYVSLGSGKNGMVINGIVTIDGEIKLTVAFKNLKQDASIKLTGLSVLLTAEGSLAALGGKAGQLGQLSINVTRFQTSLNDIDINGDILADIAGALYPVVAPLLKLPYKLASILNTSENAKIVAMVNLAIKAFAGGVKL